MAAFIAFLQIVPQLLSIFLKISKWIEDNHVNEWLNDVEKTIDDLDAAKTPEEKRAVARSLVGIIRNIPK